MKDKLITVPFNIKSMDETGVFEGYASVFNNKDSENDVVAKGAFKRTIDHKKGKWPILWQHNYREPIGVNISAEEDDHGLKVKGEIAREMPMGKTAYEWIKFAMDRGLNIGLSIGFRIVDKAVENGVRILKEIALVEYSIVTFPANDQAQVVSVKAATSFSDLPLASDTRAWSASAAVKRVWNWAGGDDNIDWVKFRKAFLIYDSAEAEKKGSYKLPIADVIGGTLKAVPRGIHAAAARLNQTDASSSDKATAKGHLNKYYSKMKKESPLKAEMVFEEGDIVLKAIDFATALANELTEQELYDLRYTIECAKGDALCSVVDDDTMTLDNKTELVSKIFVQYSGAMVAWWSKFLQYLEAEDPGDQEAASDANTNEEKAGAAISMATKKVLTSASDMHNRAYSMHKEATKLHSKGTAMIVSLASSPVSKQDPGVVPTHKDAGIPPTPVIAPPTSSGDTADDKELKALIEKLHKTVVVA